MMSSMVQYIQIGHYNGSIFLGTRMYVSSASQVVQFL